MSATASAEPPVDACTHAVQFNELCALCGKDLSTAIDDAYEAKHAVLHNSSNLKVTDEEAFKLAKESHSALMSSKKLSLVIDLDQTILHATIDPAVEAWITDSSNPNYHLKDQIHAIKLFKTHYIKFRPHLTEFLCEMARLFEMHIYTMGTREYATNIMRLVDPDGRFFGDRIIAREEDEIANFKSLKRIFPVNDSTVVIIDDRVDVWANCLNLLQVKPYCFFQGESDINDPITKILKENYQEAAADDDAPLHTDTRKSESDMELVVVGSILRTLHTSFFEVSPKLQDVKTILPMIKSSVLSGKHLVFSGVIPRTINAHEFYLWKMACDFGAVCCPELRVGVTHVIAANTATEKVQRASRMPGVFVVSVQWLVDSLQNWACQPEDKYLLVPVNGDLRDPDASLSHSPSFSSVAVAPDVDLFDDECASIFAEDDDDEEEEEEEGIEDQSSMQQEACPDDEEADLPVSASKKMKRLNVADDAANIAPTAATHHTNESSEYIDFANELEDDLFAESDSALNT